MAWRHQWALVFLCALGCKSPSESNVQWQSCALDSPLGAISAECVTLQVPENPALPTGPRVQLAVARVRDEKTDLTAPPLWVIPGGPGQSARDAYAVLAPYFRSVLRDRAIVLVDPRGTGNSEPFRCPTVDAELSSLYGGGESVDFAELAQRCAKNLQHSPEFFTTAVEVQDLDFVRRSLGLATLHLYGGSYGTRVAIEYLTRYPEVVISAVLDGVVAPDSVLGWRHDEYAERALEAMFARCAAEPSCAARYPDLRKRVHALLAKLTAAAVRVAVPHPRSGEPTSVLFRQDELLSVVRYGLYMPETVALLPYWLWQASERGDLATLAQVHLWQMDQFGRSLNPWLSVNIMCQEDLPLAQGLPPQQAFFGRSLWQSFSAACKGWPVFPAKGAREVLRGKTPVLLLSGEHDPVTPPVEAVRALPSLTHSAHLVAPGQGHIVATRGCIPRLIAGFFNEGLQKSATWQCVHELQPLPFFLSAGGP